MPASDRDLEWLERAFQEYLADNGDALDAAASALGGANLVQDSLDEWAYRDTDARAVYTRTVFVWERVLAQQPITPEALDAAWAGPNVAPLDDEAETAASRFGAFLHDLIDSAGEDDAEGAIAAAGGPTEIEAAVTRWAYRDSRTNADDRVSCVLYRLIAREPIDVGSLEAAWNLRP